MLPSNPGEEKIDCKEREDATIKISLENLWIFCARCDPEAQGKHQKGRLQQINQDSMLRNGTDPGQQRTMGGRLNPDPRRYCTLVTEHCALLDASFFSFFFAAATPPVLHTNHYRVVAGDPEPPPPLHV
jgi:hypothetical protein